MSNQNKRRWDTVRISRQNAQEAKYKRESQRTGVLSGNKDNTKLLNSVVLRLTIAVFGGQDVC